MDFKLVFTLALCLALPEQSYQQHRAKESYKSNSDVPQSNQPSNLKTILILVFGVLFVGGIIYGTTCFDVCKMYFCERTEKKYKKMDSIVHV